MDLSAFDAAFGQVRNTFLGVTVVAVGLGGLAALTALLVQRWSLRRLIPSFLRRSAKALRVLGRFFLESLRYAGYSSPFVVWHITTWPAGAQLLDQPATRRRDPSAVERGATVGRCQGGGVNLETEAIRQAGQVVEDPDDVGQLQKAPIIKPNIGQ